jgi:hypothetical protein
MDQAHPTTQAGGQLELPPQVRAAFGRGAAPELHLGLLGLAVDRLEQLGSAAERQAARGALQQLLDGWEGHERWLRRDVDGVTWLVVPDVDIQQALALARALVEAGRRLSMEVGGRRRRISLSCGLAHSRHRSHPSLATCVAVAQEGLRVAAAGGGRRAVHSEVYAAFALPEEEPAPDAAPAREVEPATPAQPAREVELPRGPQPALTRRAEPVPGDDDGPASGQPARDGPRGLHAGGAVPQAPSVPAESSGSAPPSGPESELLHRRLTKLTVELERAEAEIARLRAALTHDQAGLASIYREVQGLSDDAPEAELKREMMERLFQANIALRELSQRLQRA